MDINFGEVVYTNRRDRRLSQRDLAEILGIDYREVCRIENNRVDINLSCYDAIIKKISNLFELDILWLEEIRAQTVKKSDVVLVDAVFPVYWKDVVK